jgi:hypothetical protein
MDGISIALGIAALTVAELGLHRFLLYRRQRLWIAFAESHGGTYTPDKRWFHSTHSPGEVALNKEQYRVYGGVRIDDSDEPKVIYTTIKLMITPRHDLLILSKMAYERAEKKRSKKEALVTGFRDYDNKYMIWSSHELWAKRVISLCTRLRDLQMNGKKTVNLILEKGSLTIEQEDAPSSVEDIDALLDLTLQIAHILEETEIPAFAGGHVGMLSVAAQDRRDGAISMVDGQAAALTMVENDE